MNRKERRAALARGVPTVGTVRPEVEAKFRAAVENHKAGRLEAVQLLCREALAADPRHSDSLHLLGLTEYQKGHFELAAQLVNRAIVLNGRAPIYHITHGNALLEMGRLTDSANCFRRAISLQPNFADAYYRLGSALTEMNRADEGERYCREALRINPNLASAYVALANALEAQKRLDEAAGELRRALAMQPSVPEWEENLSYILLAKGEFAEGWELAENRLVTVAGRKSFKADANRTRWRGQDIAGRSILVRHEQGFGDIIQFCRFVPRLMERAPNVVVEVPQPLARLLGTLRGQPQIVSTGELVPDTEFMVPMLSLPLTLQIDSNSFWDGAYLQTSTEDKERWASRLGARRKNMRVGLAWSGNPDMWEDAIRSIPASMLQPFFSIPGIEFVSLQRGGAAPPADWPLIDLTAELSDFADTAALMMSLDLIISVDTAVVHLAGALGKPVWLMDRFNTCWRWLVGRRDSPWYPTLRIYRQPKPNDWDAVIAEIMCDLRSAVESQSLSPGNKQAV